ncbi:LIM-domain-containing protein [Neolentinus lepideus HHB14362 ss-1]|uniref:Cysteine-rich protein 1 n=1 Tax=Neolentinus lepideus HHB14362 ss-1 TaxID=1314782 RepID=A0A165QY88_9AGAM|nr:LIM-domain-containing protein [Neolentinus lepideus HHB14362 ss-1]
MHPFGGTPICPRCSKAVYAAEQVMGPGRKLYHKFCLTCAICNKTLDSLSLLEHDEEPYCKNCHSKAFGTRDLRQANLPHRGDTLGSPTRRSFSPPPLSPTRTGSSVSPSLITSHATSNSVRSYQERMGRSNSSSQSPVIKPTRSLSPTSPTFSSFPARSLAGEKVENGDEALDTISEEPRAAGAVANGYAVERGNASISPALTGRDRPTSPTKYASTLGRSNGSFSSSVPSLIPTMTGTRYGTALGGGPSSPSKQWGGGTPVCPKCGKNVYFAEQVKAVGKTYHRGCLRCTECNTSLDSTRLTEKEGSPYCHRCYGKLYGPAGSGYALLGKAGG